jgi:hypothetical protein
MTDQTNNRPNIFWSGEADASNDGYRILEIADAIDAISERNERRYGRSAERSYEMLNALAMYAGTIIVANDSERRRDFFDAALNLQITKCKAGGLVHRLGQ